MPGHQFVDALLGPTIDQARQQGGDVELRIDAVDEDLLDQQRRQSKRRLVE